jgi:hypothetical protein
VQADPDPYHNHQGFGYRWPCHIALLRRMGPRLRGDDIGESLLHVSATPSPVRRFMHLDEPGGEHMH